MIEIKCINKVDRGNPFESITHDELIQIEQIGKLHKKKL